MRNIKYILKATVAVAIALAFVMPGAATIVDKGQIAVEEPTIHPKLLGMNPGWVEQASGFWEPSRGIGYMHAVDENIVWAAGYDGVSGAPCQEFTRTINGGELWEADVIFGAPDDGDLAMIFALDADHAWIPIHSGDPQGIWATSDGGDTWVHQDTADYNGVGAFPNIVHFWDENNGWCQGDPVDGYFEMYTTTNGGDTWTRVPSQDIPAPLPGEYGVVGYYDVVGDTVWWGTANAYPLRVFKSTDRGYTWTVAETPFAAGSYIDIRFKDANNGLAMDKNFADAVLAETSDGGETWSLISYTGKCHGADFDYVPGTDNMYVSTGVQTGVPENNGATFSLDGGHSWASWSEVEGIQLFGTTWVEGGIGWAGNFNEDEFTGGVYKYSPGEVPDLDCSGDLSWEDVAPGETVTGSFTVSNIGAGMLDWEISEYPTDWGTWSFDPESGTDLSQGDSVTVDVEVVAPDEEETTFTGEVKVINSEDPSDYCIIDVSLATPVSQESDGLFGWVFLRGLVFNPREDGSTINARAINLQYFEITPQGINKGVARLKKVSFRNGIFIKMSERGLFGYTVHVSGFCHGGIDIQ